MTFDCNILAQYEYISFDVFDTLIQRSVTRPQGVWEMVRTVYKDRYGRDAYYYSTKRSYAATYARAKYGAEVNINQIYEFIGYEENIAQTLMSIEKELEIVNCLPNVAMVEILKELNALGKKIIITSDMYLTRDVFNSIFSKIGITYDRMFISCEEMASKREGRLFQVILNKLNILPEQIIHIGDNLVSDIQNPTKYGIKAIEREIVEKHLKSYISENDISIEADHLKKVFDYAFLNISKKDDSFFRIGYTVFGPFLYSFCRWIHQQKIDKHIDRLFFIAREGYLIKKVYDSIYPEEENNTVYLCLNKNLMRFPMLTGDNAINNFMKSLPAWDSYSWNYLLSYLGLEYNHKLIETFRKKYSLNMDNVVKRDDILCGKYDEIINFLILSIQNKVDEQSLLLRQYLHEQGVLNHRVGLINNSKNGNSQILLEKYAKANNLTIDIYGLQLIASTSCKKFLKERVLTFWGKPYDAEIDSMLFFKNCLLFEHILFPKSGTAKLFYRGCNQRVEVMCDEQGIEVCNNEIIDKIQHYILRFISDYQSHVNLGMPQLAKEIIQEFFYYPFTEDAHILGDLWDKDVEGERKMFEESVEYSSELFIQKTTPLYPWMSGFLSAKNKERKWLILWKARIVAWFYLRGGVSISSDFVSLIKRTLLMSCNKIRFFWGVLFMRFCLAIKLRLSI